MEVNSGYVKKIIRRDKERGDKIKFIDLAFEQNEQGMRESSPYMQSTWVPYVGTVKNCSFQIHHDK